MTDVAPLHPRTIDRLLVDLPALTLQMLEGLHLTEPRSARDITFAMGMADFAGVIRFATPQSIASRLQGLATRGLVNRSHSRACGIRWTLTYRGGALREAHREQDS